MNTRHASHNPHKTQRTSRRMCMSGSFPLRSLTCHRPSPPIPPLTQLPSRPPSTPPARLCPGRCWSGWELPAHAPMDPRSRTAPPPSRCRPIPVGGIVLTVAMPVWGSTNWARTPVRWPAAMTRWPKPVGQRARSRRRGTKGARKGRPPMRAPLTRVCPRAHRGPISRPMPRHPGRRRDRRPGLPFRQPRAYGRLDEGVYERRADVVLVGAAGRQKRRVLRWPSWAARTNWTRPWPC